MRPQVARVLPQREAGTFNIDDGDVVLAAGIVRGIDQRAHDLLRVPGKHADDVGDGAGRHQIGQPVAAEEER